MLNDLACKAAINEAKRLDKPLKKFDRNGLYLLATANGLGYWYYKYRINGREKKISFRPYPKITLAEARDKHYHASKDVLESRDPSLKRQQEKQQAKLDRMHTVERLGMSWYDHVKAQWSENHAQTILRRLKKDLFATIGHLPAKEVTSRILLTALQKIEERGSNEIARRNLQYANNIFSYGRLQELLSHNPATDLEGALAPYQRGHFPSMTLEELPTFLQKFERNEARLSVDTREAMELLMLTLLRTNELLGCEWSEVYFDAQRIIIPGKRMKHKKGCPKPQDHIVPLSTHALQILQRRKQRNDALEQWQQSKYVFPSYKGPHKHLHNRTIGKALFRMDYQGVHTGHGFRALGMGIAKEKLGYAHDIIDRQLAHIPADELRRSYDRAKYLPQRTEMTQKIADYIDSIKPGVQKSTVSISHPLVSYHYQTSYYVSSLGMTNYLGLSGKGNP